MKPFRESMKEYQRQMEKGEIREAYRGLMEYMMRLRSHFERKYPDYVVSGSLYPGYMDMTYFAFSSESMRDRRLKAAIVFLHDSFRFEVWLAGNNKQVQLRYWKLIKESGWSKYRIPSTTKGSDSIIEHTLIESPDFGDLDALTRSIENGTMLFIKDVEDELKLLER